MKSIFTITVSLLVPLFAVTFAYSQAGTNRSALPETRLKAPDITTYYTTIENMALDWNKVFIDGKNLPPKESRFVFLERRIPGDWDTLRMRYAAGDWDVTLSQSASLFAVQVERINKGSPEKFSSELLRTFFKTFFLNTADVELQPSATDQRSGKVVITPAVDKINWLKGLRWQYTDVSAVFWFIKDDGMPSGMDKGIDDDTNTRWFSR